MSEMRDPELWERLNGYNFDYPPLARSLGVRFQEETGHSLQTYTMVLEEYRRFIYLVGCADLALAPSPIVDVVWHLHILDTRAYFEDFCPNVLGRVVHHQPGGPDIYHDPAYQRTLELYEQEFGEVPNPRIWPKSTWSGGGKLIGVGALLAVVLFVVGGVSGQTWLVFVGIVLVAAVILRQAAKGPIPKKAGSNNDGCSSSCGGD